MPKRRAAWSCWNYLTRSSVDANTGECKANIDQVALTYCMNQLQHISEEEHGPVLVTLNPLSEPDPAQTIGRYKYDHPVLDGDAIHAQDEMHKIQNKRGISFAGAWLKYGFHEDGFTSGLRAALSVSGTSSITYATRPQINDLLRSVSDDIRPPFDVRTADRPAQDVSVALIFDVLEKTGIRLVIGGTLGLCLDWCGSLLAVILAWFLDLLGV
ncbi:hypothetical protein NM688_g2620 [Phlebia brevispora]|uniref:Uncharacterized protein n=1 Tax=Phlebia brevispora TaxID=194682 RepID=A0ACC1T7T9_9APHY|nr:hypothetical protein NM688_g2620 [Phlebia brevispora]